MDESFDWVQASVKYDGTLSIAWKMLDTGAHGSTVYGKSVMHWTDRSIEKLVVRVTGCQFKHIEIVRE